MEDFKKTEVSWNIIAEQTKFVSELLQKGIRDYYLRGDIGGWFNILTGVREIINHDLKEEEINEIDALEKELWGKKFYWNKYNLNVTLGHISDKTILIKKNEFSERVKDYSRSIMKSLNRLGYFPKKEDRTKLSF